MRNSEGRNDGGDGVGYCAISVFTSFLQVVKDTGFGRVLVRLASIYEVEADAIAFYERVAIGYYLLGTIPELFDE